MKRSALAPLFRRSLAAQLPASLRSPQLHALAERIDLIAAEWQRVHALPAELTARLADEGVEIADLADALRLASARLRAQVPTNLETVPWVQFAQEVRDLLPFSCLAGVADHVLGLASRHLSAHTQSLAELHLWECMEAADAFRQRYTIAQDAQAIANEVCTGLDRAAELLREDLQSTQIQVLADDLADTLLQWSACAADMGSCVDLELIRVFMTQLVARHALPPRIWSLLVLRLDRAFAVRANGHLEHAFADALAALLAATTRFDFLRDLSTEALFYLPAGAALWGELALCTLVVRLRPGSRIAARYARALSLEDLGQFQGAPRAEIEQAVRLGLQSLRGRWERNYLDLYADTCAQLLDWAAIGERLTALAQTEGGADGALAIAALNAAAMGSDLHERRGLFHAFCSHLPLTVLHTGAPHAAIPAALALPTALSTSVQELYATAATSIRSNGDLDGSQAWLLARRALHGNTQVERVLQQFVSLHRIFDAHEARAEMRSRLSHALLDATTTTGSSDLLAGLQAVIRYSGQSPHWQGSRLATLLQQFHPSIIAVAAASKISRGAAELADGASAQVLARHPDYAQRIGSSGQAATRRDNFYTLLRLGQVLGGASPDPKEAMSWWWRSTIGVYLHNRDGSVMQDNLRALADGLRQTLSETELQLSVDVLACVYRVGLSVEIPRDLVTDAVLSFQPLLGVGPLWHSVFDVGRGNEAHHRLVSPSAASAAHGLTESLEVRAVLQTMQASWAQCGDPEQAWTAASSRMHQALQRVGAAALLRAWVNELSATNARGVYTQMLAEPGVERLHLLAFARAFPTRLQACADAMAALAGRLPETPPERAESYAAKGRRDLGLLFRILQRELEAGAPAIAQLNTGRYLTECILPFVRFSAASWRRLWARGLSQLLPTLGLPEQFGAQRCFALLMAVSDHAEELGSAGQMLFAATGPVFSDDPIDENRWRSLVSGLLVCACVEQELQQGRALAQELALAAPLFTDDGIAAWHQGSASLRELLAAALGPALRLSLDAVMQALNKSLTAAAVMAQTPSACGLDAANAVRSEHWMSATLWRADRLVRMLDEKLTTPMPGDLVVSRATGWLCPDMVGLRRAHGVLTEALQLSTDDPTNAALLRGTWRLALTVGFLREGAPYPQSRRLAMTLAGFEWSGLEPSALRVALAALRAEVVDSGGGDSDLGTRIAEIERGLGQLHGHLFMLREQPADTTTSARAFGRLACVHEVDEDGSAQAPRADLNTRLHAA